MKVYVLNLASPAAAIMLEEPQLWPQIVSTSSTVTDLKADLIRKQVAQDMNFKLHLCTDPYDPSGSTSQRSMCSSQPTRCTFA